MVGRDTAGAPGVAAGAPTRNALDVHMLRLRRRIAPLGLEVRTVRSRGYLLQMHPRPTARSPVAVVEILLDILIVLVAAKIAAEIAERINVPGGRRRDRRRA